MLKPRNTEERQQRLERQRRLMGPLLDIFDLLHGRTWVTIVGAVILLILVVVSFLPI